MAIKRDSVSYAAPVGDKRDCAVRALSIAANMPYGRAHAYYQMAGRKDNKGTPWAATQRLFGELGYERLNTYCWQSSTVGSMYSTVAQFLRMYPVGRFWLCRHGHAFAVVDGVVHDWVRGTGARSRVLVAWRVKVAE